MKELIKEQRDVINEVATSDEGGCSYIECPNCYEKVTFTDRMWWNPNCRCGTWSLEQRAVLDVGDD